MTRVGYRDFFQKAPVAYCSVSSRTARILICNDMTDRLLGYDRDELMETKIFEVYPDTPQGLPMAHRLFELFQSSQSIAGARVQMQRKDGGTCWVRHFIDPVLDRWGDVTASRSVMVPTDASETVAGVWPARDHAELADVPPQHQTGPVADIVAHELKRPLTAIANYAEGCMRRLRSNGVQPTELAAVMEKMRDLARQAALSGENVVDLFDAAQGRQNRFDIQDLIGGVLERLQSDIRASGTAVELAGLEALPPALANRADIELVVANLARNAIEAMRDSGRPRLLRIRAMILGIDLLEVTVQDSGPGIRPAHGDRIFERLYTTKSAGLGLGLSLCRTAVERNGGTIWATSAPNRGATFHFTLPLCDEAAPRPGIAPCSPPDHGAAAGLMRM